MTERPHLPLPLTLSPAETEAMFVRILDHLTSQQRHDNELLRREVLLEVAAIKETVGKVNEQGTGGTGLAGAVARNNTRVDDLFRIKHIGMGIVTAVALVAGLLYIGIKAWVIAAVSR